MEGSRSLLLIVAGLVLFLYALNRLSDALKELTGDKMTKVIDRFTSNVFTGILTGLFVTILLDSSSAIIIMSIALVNARAMTFRQAMGVVMGANIGKQMMRQFVAENLRRKRKSKKTTKMQVQILKISILLFSVRS